MMKKAQLLALCTVVAGTAHAAVTGSVAAPTLIDDNQPDNSVNLTTLGTLDWLRITAASTAIEKAGANYLSWSATSVGGGYPNGSGYNFNWTDGAGTVSATNSVTMNNMQNMVDQAGWTIQATGLSAGTYQMGIYAVRTDGTPFSFVLLDGTTQKAISTTNGTAITGANTESIFSTLTFTVDGTSDIMNAKFIRDTTNGTIGNSTSNNVLAIGAVTLTAVPEPSTYGLMGAGAIAAAAMLRRRRNRAA